jgi:hypothetical protein
MNLIGSHSIGFVATLIKKLHTNIFVNNALQYLTYCPKPPLYVHIKSFLQNSIFVEKNRWSPLKCSTTSHNTTLKMKFPTHKPLGKEFTLEFVLVCKGNLSRPACSFGKSQLYIKGTCGSIQPEFP